MYFLATLSYNEYMATGRSIKPRHIIKSFEAQESKRRPISVKIADIFASRFGTLAFLIINIIFFATWITINSGYIRGVEIFDPYPFIFLTMTVSLEAIILSIIVLISQNRGNQIASLRQELQLQVNLITERDITKVLKILKEIREEGRRDYTKDMELEDMIEDIDAGYIERKLQDQIESLEGKPIAKIQEKIKETIIAKK